MGGRFMLRFLLCSSVFTISWGQTTLVAPPTATPAAITAGVVSTVTVSALIASSGRSILPNSVNLLQVQQDGSSAHVIGTLNDNGTAGDLIAGDGVFGGTVSISQSTPGNIFLRVSAAFSGTLRRTFSTIITLPVLAPGVPVVPKAQNPTMTTTDAATGATVICNELLVMFQTGVSASTATSIIASSGGQLVGTLPALGIYQVIIPTCDAQSLTTARNIFVGNALVRTAEFDGVAGIRTVTSSPNDPYFIQQTLLPQATATPQWGLARIDTSGAWAVAQAKGVKGGAALGIIDSGINANHEDLFGHVVSRINWCAQVTNGNCIINNTNTDDDFGHGTFVAGLAAALSDNGVGIASPAFNALIFAEKITSPAHSTTTMQATILGIAYAIVDAVSGGARVLNLSVGVDQYATLEEAIKYANRRNVIVVAAAGNEGKSSPNYPAGYSVSYTNVIAVGATDENDRLSIWHTSNGKFCNPDETGSNYGSWVSVYAPGSEIFSLRYNANTGQNAYGYDIHASEPSCSAGTSFSTPLVAGTASLMLAVNPKLDVATIRTLLSCSADAIGKDPENNPMRRLNAQRAVQYASLGMTDCPNNPPTAGFTMSAGSQSGTESQTLNLTVPPGSSANVTFDATTRSTGNGDASITSWQWTVDSVPAATTGSFSRPFGAGSYSISLTVTDSRGAISNPVTATVAVTTSSSVAVAATATLDGAIWPSSGTASLNYNIAEPQGTIIGQGVPGSTANLPPGHYTLSYQNGGPPNSTFIGIAPCQITSPPSTSCTQTLTAGQTLTFTLQFKSNPPTAGFMMSSGSLAKTEGQSLNLMVAQGGNAAVLFDATTRSSAVNSATITSWQWKIGNVTAATASTFSKAFSVGTYIVSLVVTDSRGVQSTAVTGTIGVTTSSPPVAGFTMSFGNQSATEGQTLNLMVASGGSASVNFNANRSTTPNGSIVGWQWMIDGSPASTQSSFAQTLTKGMHPVTLVVTDNLGGTSQPVQGTVAVTESGPTAGSVSINAILDGNSWNGLVNYEIITPNGVTIGSSVPASSANQTSGTYTFVNKGGGPANSILTGVSLSQSQTLTQNNSVTFTLYYITRGTQPVPFFDGTSDSRFTGYTFGEPAIDSQGRLLVESLRGSDHSVRLNSIASTGETLNWQTASSTWDGFARLVVTLGPGDRAYISPTTQTVIAYDVSGNLVPGWPITVAPSAGSVKIDSGPLIDPSDGTVYVRAATYYSLSSSPFWALAYNPDGSLKWHTDYPDGAQLGGQLVLGPSRTLYMTGVHDNPATPVLGISRDNGNQFCSSNPAQYGVLAGDGTAALGSLNSDVSLLDLSCKGSTIYHSGRDIVSPFGMSGGFLFSAEYNLSNTDARTLSAVSKDTGLLWSTPLSFSEVKGPVNGVLYVLGTDASDGKAKLFLYGAGTGLLLNAVETAPFCSGCGLAISTSGTVFVNDLTSTKVYKLN